MSHYCHLWRLLKLFHLRGCTPMTCLPFMAMQTGRWISSPLSRGCFNPLFMNQTQTRRHTIPNKEFFFYSFDSFFLCCDKVAFLSYIILNRKPFVKDYLPQFYHYPINTHRLSPFVPPSVYSSPAFSFYASALGNSSADGRYGAIFVCFPNFTGQTVSSVSQ